MSIIRVFTREETVTLQKLVTDNGESRMDLLNGIRNSFKGHPGAVLNQAVKAGLIEKHGQGENATYTVINNKGGEIKEENNSSSNWNDKVPMTPEYQDMIFSLGEIKKELFKIYPTIFGGIKSVEYGGKASVLFSGENKQFYNFLTKQGQEMVELLYYGAVGRGLIKED